MSLLTIVSNLPIAKAIYQLELSGAKAHKPGQFVMIQINQGVELFLRRPFSIMESDKDRLKIIYKVVGTGTQLLSKMTPGTGLDVLEQLGNGFKFDDQPGDVCLIGGGTGIPPLYGLAKTLASMNKKMTIILGFQSREETFLIPEFSSFGKVIVTTIDGSLGLKGNITRCQNEWQSVPYYAVGPLGMLKAIAKENPDGQISLEERMGCGFGACVGCTILTSEGPKQVCFDGPVFAAKEIIWEN
ncbi:MAG: dihydroorotate dehydrogenase electron transfer subunit [Candidatus Izemoplasmatales bacterium]|jgi:dihydroorotate dehydrogenase electron transfer subunit